jgi:hypothetical protein
MEKEQLYLFMQFLLMKHRSSLVRPAPNALNAIVAVNVFLSSLYSISRLSWSRSLGSIMRVCMAVLVRVLIHHTYT